jgi:hypothetical protein
MKAYAAREKLKDRTLVAITSGANMNFDRLRFVAERAEVGEAREALFGVTIPERPGSFREFCTAIGPRVVTEFNYRLAGRDAAHIFVGLKTASREDGLAVAAGLRARGYATLDLTDDEMAKLHVRHMVGGRATARDERLYRFEFPERPGALMEFLEKLGGRWNISLFHYRNPARLAACSPPSEVPDIELGSSAASSTASATLRSPRTATRPTRCSWPATGAPEARHGPSGPHGRGSCSAAGPPPALVEDAQCSLYRRAYGGRSNASGIPDTAMRTGVGAAVGGLRLRATAPGRGGEPGARRRDAGEEALGPDVAELAIAREDDGHGRVEGGDLPDDAQEVRGRPAADLRGVPEVGVLRLDHHGRVGVAPELGELLVKSLDLVHVAEEVLARLPLDGDRGAFSTRA